MDQTAILYPMMALVGWTLCVLLVIPYRRFQAAFAREVTIEDFRLGESHRVPYHVSLANRNFMNLLEVPVLFYVVCIILYVSQGVTSLLFVLAWAYVACRVFHSLVHLTYNRVIHRLGLFAASNLVLLALWVMTALDLTA
ncbi:MAG: MAPEG family protein [Pseudohongiellaceae bacterium]